MKFSDKWSPGRGALRPKPPIGFSPRLTTEKVLPLTLKRYSKIMQKSCQHLIIWNGSILCSPSCHVTTFKILNSAFSESYFNPFVSKGRLSSFLGRLFYQDSWFRYSFFSKVPKVRNFEPGQLKSMGSLMTSTHLTVDQSVSRK